MRAYQRFLDYGVPRNDLRAGLLLIRGRNYALKPLDLIVQLPGYARQEFKEALGWLAAEPAKYAGANEIGMLLHHASLFGLPPEDIICPPSPAARRWLMRRWQEEFGEGYDAAIGSLKGALLERYALLCLERSLEATGVPGLLYRNLRLTKAAGSKGHDSPKQPVESDILIVARPEDARTAIDSLQDRYGATVKWRAEDT